MTFVTGRFGTMCFSQGEPVGPANVAYRIFKMDRDDKMAADCMADNKNASLMSKWSELLAKKREKLVRAYLTKTFSSRKQNSFDF
jgi:hypothetical protein